MSRANIDKNQFRNQSKLLITLDWLTFNVLDTFQYLTFDENNHYTHENFVLELIPNQRTKNFDKCMNVYYHGEFVMVVTCQSNSELILKGRAHVKIENHLFYSDTAKEVFEAFKEAFNINSLKISRVDIACDGVYLHNFLNQFLYGKNCTINHVNIGRVRDLDNITPILPNREDIKNNQFSNYYIGNLGNKSVGSSRSNKFARYYNKSRELKSHGKKEYIENYYKINGFEGEVFRYEIQLNATAISEIMELKYHEIFDKQVIEKIFRTSNEQFFEFYYKTDKKVSRCPRVEMFEGIGEGKFQKIKRKVKRTLKTVQIAIKRLYHEIRVGAIEIIEEQINIDDTIELLLQRFNLREWYETKFPYWDYEIKKEKIKFNLI
ncbi:MAG: hypothetical protein HYR91_06195 [Flavobacteriia bacterium]|nr:hypothetical protein [Flavobacteriia bacterium]